MSVLPRVALFPSFRSYIIYFTIKLKDKLLHELAEGLCQTPGCPGKQLTCNNKRLFIRNSKMFAFLSSRKDCRQPGGTYNRGKKNIDLIKLRNIYQTVRPRQNLHIQITNQPAKLILKIWICYSDESRLIASGLLSQQFNAAVCA